MSIIKELDSKTTNTTITNQKKSLLSIVIKQFKRILIHIVNLLSNILGNDFISCELRKLLFQVLGAKFGKGSVIHGGGYLYGGGLVVGNKCHINRNCYFDVTELVSCGDYVTVGHGVTFITSKHNIGDSNCRAGAVTGFPIAVKDGVWIGANATILPGITVESGAIIAAGAVVTKNVPANVVVAGIPATTIRELSITIDYGTSI